MRSPPTVNRTRSTFYLCGLISDTIQPYVEVLLRGTSLNGMKEMVLVPLTSRVPCERRPSSLENARFQTSGHCPGTLPDDR